MKETITKINKVIYRYYTPESHLPFPLQLQCQKTFL